jgi:NDP-sugar pyrophosphorylase family protein
MIKIIVPLGSNLMIDESGQFNYPLPLIEINGKSLIEYVIDDLNKINEKKEFIFILKDEDCNKYKLDKTLNLLVPDAKIIRLQSPTKGAICSILMAIDDLNIDDETIIVNSDQIIDCDYNSVLNHFRTNLAEGGIICFRSVHPRWSYAKIIDDLVVQTEEKTPISNNAIAGFYYFKNGSTFVNSSFNVIKFDQNYEGNYYTSSVFNQLILNGMKVLSYNINSDSYHTFYSIPKLKEFEKHLNNESI